MSVTALDHGCVGHYGFDLQGRCRECGRDFSVEVDELLDREAVEMEAYMNNFKPGDIEYDLANGGCMVAFVESE